jgi:hypothetical protein
MLVVSLTHLTSHMLEQGHRQRVMANGMSARAIVRQPSGHEWVTVDWRDAADRVRTGTAWTGKPFARLLKEGRGAQTVDIKYAHDPALEPVIVSEAAERERANQWWIRVDTGMAVFCTIMVAWSVLVFFWFRSAPKPTE